MKKITILLLFFLLALTGCKNDDSQDDPTPKDILQKLQEIDGVTVTEITPRDSQYSRAFQIDFTQAVDHNSSSGATFKQRAYLYHSKEDLPMIMNTAGYVTGVRSSGELGRMFSNNYITINHRYFRNAEPASKEWQYLTVKQSADDLHSIREKLKGIYTGKWLTTGASKGGMTALFYKYFHRNDIDATVAYVAPIMTGLPDKRFDDYLKFHAGDATTIQKIQKFQMAVLDKRTEIIELIKNSPSTSNMGFSSVGYDAALELAVLEYWFYFFQYGAADPATIPSEDASAADLFAHLQSTSSVSYYNDDQYYTYMPFYYQAFTELGYYYFIDDHLRNRLTTIKDASHKILTPPDTALNYSPDLMNSILAWLKTEGHKVIYIYGGRDPYTYTPVDPGSSDALKYILPGVGHSANITGLNSTDREVVLKKLEEWMGVTINRNYASGRKASDFAHSDLRRPPLNSLNN